MVALFSSAYASLTPDVRWWGGIAIVCVLLGAHLVALGVTYALIGLIVCLAYVYTPWLWANTHERGLAIVVGGLIAFGILVVLEIYLGASSLYYGPIGAKSRAALSWIDEAIADLLICAYRAASEFKSWMGLLAYSLAYFLLSWLVTQRAKVAALKRLPARTDAYILNTYTGFGTLVGVLLMFPFAHSVDGRRVNFSEAVFDVSSSFKTLGRYETAKKQAEEDNQALRRFLSQLQDSARAEQRNDLADAIADHAKLLLQLDDLGRERIQILHQPPAEHRTTPFLRPAPDRFPDPAYPDLEPVPPDGDFDNVRASDVVRAEELRERRTVLLKDLERLQEARDAALFLIRKFIADEVQAQLGGMRRSEVVDTAVRDILQTILLLDIAEAVLRLRERMAEVRRRIEQEIAQNRQLQQSVQAYRGNLLGAKRAESRCGGELSRVARYLQQEDRPLLNRIERNRERAQEWLRRNGAVRDRFNVPPGIDRPRIERDVEEELRREGGWPPTFRVSDLQGELSKISEGGAGPVSAFADQMCRSGRSSEEIILALRRLDSELGQPLEPRRNLR